MIDSAGWDSAYPNLLMRQFPVTHRRHQHLWWTVSKWCYQQYLMPPQSLPRAASFMYLWEVMQPQVQFPAARTGWIRRGPRGSSCKLFPNAPWTGNKWRKKQQQKKVQWAYWYTGCGARPWWSLAFKDLDRKWSPSLGTWWADSEESAQDKATEAAEHQLFLGKGIDTKPCCELL